jgi:uncharacterized DUF497 family protein
MRSSEFEWDPRKSSANFQKHRVHFADAAEALFDPLAITGTDPDSNGELRFLALAQDTHGRILITVYAHAGERIRIISSRKASPAERRQYFER